MTTPIPKDIESCEQWQTRWEAAGGHEVVRTGTERQVRYIAQANAAYGAIVEKRSITVGPWVDPDAPARQGAPCGYEHDGDCGIECSERAARDALRAAGAWPAEEPDEADG